MSAVADGGDRTADGLPRRGEFVVDFEANRSKQLIVLEVYPNSTVRGWYIYDVDAVLLDAFPDADPTDRVVTIAYADELVEKISIEDIGGANDLTEVVEKAGVTTYDYPISRLKPTEGGSR